MRPRRILEVLRGSRRPARTRGRLLAGRGPARRLTEGAETQSGICRPGRIGRTGRPHRTRHRRERRLRLHRYRADGRRTTNCNPVTLPSPTVTGSCVPASSRYCYGDAVAGFCRHPTTSDAASAASRPERGRASRRITGPSGTTRRHERRHRDQRVCAVGDAVDRKSAARVGPTLIEWPHHGLWWSGGILGREPPTSRW